MKVELEIEAGQLGETFVEVLNRQNTIKRNLDIQ